MLGARAVLLGARGIRSVGDVGVGVAMDDAHDEHRDDHRGTDQQGRDGEDQWILIDCGSGL